MKGILPKFGPQMYLGSQWWHKSIDHSANVCVAVPANQISSAIMVFFKISNMWVWINPWGRVGENRDFFRKHRFNQRFNPYTTANVHELISEDFRKEDQLLCKIDVVW